MTMKRGISLALFSVCVLACVSAQSEQSRAALPTPNAADIMARVAANQDSAEAERAHYVFVQHATMSSRKGKTVQCEEVTDYRITPSDSGIHDELVKLDGRLRVNGNYVTYHTLAPDNDNSKVENDKDSVSVTIGGENADRDMVEHMRANLMHDKSKDGLNSRLFPLTSKEQTAYDFQLVGQERLNGRNVYHITFRPKDKDDFGWKGDAFVDVTTFQPVLVTTGMARKIPFAVRTFLGTNLPGLGFTVVYAPQPDGVWFPTSFSTEFKIHVLYFFHRDIVLDAQNRDFEKTHVTSRMLGDVTPVEPEKP
jgi:hypothetical protein